MTAGVHITRFELACGMPLVVEENPGVASAALTWYLPAGSATDPEDRQGISSMLAELVFRGAGSVGSREQADALDKLGLSRGCEVGGFHLRLSATMLASKLMPALPMLVDIVRRPRLDAEQIEPVRDLALQALAGLKDQPQERAGILLTNLHNHPPLNRSGMGTEAGLAAITREDLTRQWALRVKPRGAILGISGNVKGAEIAARLDQLLSGGADAWEGAAPEVTWTASTTRGSYHHEEEPSSQVHIYLSHEAPREGDPDAKFERIVNSVLSGGSSSRLFTEVRERRALCYSVAASYGTDKHWGRVSAYVGTTPDKAQQSLDVLSAELARILTPAGAVTAQEFQRAVVGYKSRLVFSGESTGARAAALAADVHRLGRPRSLAELAAEVDTIALADVNAYLARRKVASTTIVTLGQGRLKRPE